ncbi:MAG TPA: AAA family ATPase, partial [Steroidobacteraceae bacterium]|nr:AAA family ATPase [Steroidobacteraceae bacterium]
MPAQFIGRTDELATLARLLEQSVQGQGSVLAVAGDPGIGKTRLMAEGARLAASRGFRVLWSQMIEDPVAPPYFPWLLALRSGLQQIDDETLRSDLGSGARDVADLLPELADRLGIPPPREAGDANTARFRLFDSIARFLLALARRQPLILLFDNLHLADRSTLQLLEYCCRQITTSPIVMVIAYRGSEVGESQPLQGMLGRIARTVGFESLELRGLARNDVARLLHARLGQPAGPAIVDALFERSDGNPLYVCEVAAELQRRVAADALATLAIDFKLPDSLREVIAERLASLDQRTLGLLRTAAVLGRDFDAGLLATVVQQDLELITPALDAARAAGVTVALEPRRFRFQHALFREVLYEQHGRQERIALHRAAAVGLERSSSPSNSTSIAQLAYHYFESARAGHDARAVRYCREAAREALARRAYGEAVVQLERALQVVELAADLDSLARYEVLSALGDAQYRAGSVNQAAQTLLKAALLAHRLEWWDRLPDAVIELQNMLGQIGIGHVAAVPLHQVAIDHLPEGALATRVRLLASMSLAYRYQRDGERATATLYESVRLARALGDATVLMASLQRATWVLWETPEGAIQEAMLREA